MTPKRYAELESAIHLLMQECSAGNAAEHRLSMIARKMGYSEAHFQKIFKAAVGISPKQFVAYLSHQAARKRLRKSGPLLEATLDLGLSSPSRLHESFVRIERMTPGEFRDRAPQIQWAFYPSCLGVMLVCSTSMGICRVEFVALGTTAGAAREHIADAYPGHILRQAQKELKKTAAEIERRLWGKSSDPLSLVLSGSDFQLQVWEALLRIPEGSQSTYGNIARLIRKPRAARAVGTAIGQNPIGYLIPCHRVLRESGQLGGYRWGLERKAAMLARESLKLLPQPALVR